MINLHVHLDGSLSKEMMHKLCLMSGRDPSEINNATISVKEQGTLEDYLECFAFPCSLLESKENISYAVYALFKELYKQGNIYAEVRFAPEKCKGTNLTQEDVVKAAIEGLEKAKEETKMPGNLILCCMRSFSDEANIETVEVAKKYLKKGVCGLDLAGPEVGFPNDMYAHIFALARSYDIPFTIHAGENLGPENVWAAIKLGAKRIGHGIRAAEDPMLLSFLGSAKIALEICPTSERDTHCVPSLDAIPIRKFMKYGIPIVLGDDDETVSSTNLKKEIEILKNVYGLTEAELDQIEKDSIQASFLEEDQKEFLLEIYEKEKLGKKD